MIGKRLSSLEASGTQATSLSPPHHSLSLQVPLLEQTGKEKEETTYCFLTTWTRSEAHHFYVYFFGKKKEKENGHSQQQNKAKKCSLHVNQRRKSSRWPVAHPISPSDHCNGPLSPLSPRRGSLHTRVKRGLVKCELLSVAFLFKALHVFLCS